MDCLSYVYNYILNIINTNKDYTIIKQVYKKNIFLVTDYHNNKFIIKLKNNKEHEFLSEFDCDNIIKIKDVYNYQNNDYLVFDFYPYGDLFDYVDKNYITEYQANIIIKNILLALYECQKKNISHLDIKLENILIKDITNLDLVLIDFHLAKKNNLLVNKTNKLGGSINYAAPEIFYGYYTQKSDIWSLGIILYILIKKEFLYKKPTKKVNSDYIKKHINYLNCSTNCKDFLNKCLTINHESRADVNMLLNHKWINNEIKLYHL